MITLYLSDKPEVLGKIPSQKKQMTRFSLRPSYKLIKKHQLEANIQVLTETKVEPFSSKG